MKKSYLLTPGPTQVPESILAGFARPPIHHRTPAFKTLFSEVRQNLKYLFQTKEEVLTLASSGTGAMEATISNLFSAGDEVLTLNAGKFGARWGKIALAYGLKVTELKASAPGQSIEASHVEQALKANTKIRGVLFQASETSTGVTLPVADICRLTQSRPHCLAIVDAITALGVMDLPMDGWGIDVLITGSQKGLMLPPGLAFIALSQKAWVATTQSKLPKFYFNLTREREAQTKDQTAWTPAISLIQGLSTALQIMRAEGLEAILNRHNLCAQATRAGVTALGLELLAPHAPSPAVTAVKVPAAISDGKLIPKTMREDHGVTIAGGQDELEGQIFRLTHMGYIDKFDILIGIGALELTLQKLGYKNFSLGSGTGAVLKAFSNVKL